MDGYHTVIRMNMMFIFTHVSITHSLLFRLLALSLSLFRPIRIFIFLFLCVWDTLFSHRICSSRRLFPFAIHVLGVTVSFSNSCSFPWYSIFKTYDVCICGYSFYTVYSSLALSFSFYVHKKANVKIYHTHFTHRSTQLNWARFCQIEREREFDFLSNLNFLLICFTGFLAARVSASE